MRTLVQRTLVSSYVTITIACFTALIVVTLPMFGRIFSVAAISVIVGAVYIGIFSRGTTRLRERQETAVVAIAYAFCYVFISAVDLLGAMWIFGAQIQRVPYFPFVVGPATSAVVATSMMFSRRHTNSMKKCAWALTGAVAAVVSLGFALLMFRLA